MIEVGRVRRIYAEKPVSQQVSDSLSVLDDAIKTAIAAAKDSGVPQGLVVAVLAGHQQIQLNRLIAIMNGEE